MKKTTTVRMSPGMTRRVRLAAGKADTSVSAFVSLALLEKMPLWESCAASPAQTHAARLVLGK